MSVRSAGSFTTRPVSPTRWCSSRSGGVDWARGPTILPPLILSLVALAIPFLIMQPGLGLGIAASKHPHPWAARLRSFTGHLAFGLGLYLAARVSLLVIPG